MRQNLGGACGLRKIARTPAQGRHLGTRPKPRGRADASTPRTASNSSQKSLHRRGRNQRRNPCTAEDGTRVEIPPPKINRGLLYWSGDPEPPRSPAGVPASRRTPCRFQTRALWRAVRIATNVRTPLQHTAGVFLCAIVSPPQQPGRKSRAPSEQPQFSPGLRPSAYSQLPVTARRPDTTKSAAPGYGPPPGHSKIRSSRLPPGPQRPGPGPKGTKKRGNPKIPSRVIG